MINVYEVKKVAFRDKSTDINVDSAVLFSSMENFSISQLIVLFFPPTTSLSVSLSALSWRRSQR